MMMTSWVPPSALRPFFSKDLVTILPVRAIAMSIIPRLDPLQNKGATTCFRNILFLNLTLEKYILLAPFGELKLFLPHITKKFIFPEWHPSYADLCKVRV